MVPDREGASFAIWVLVSTRTGRMSTRIVPMMSGVYAFCEGIPYRCIRLRGRICCIVLYSKSTSRNGPFHNDALIGWAKKKLANFYRPPSSDHRGFLLVCRQVHRGCCALGAYRPVCSTVGDTGPLDAVPRRPCRTGSSLCVF